MQNTPAGCGSHLPTILRTFKNQPKSRSVNILSKCSDLRPAESIKMTPLGVDVPSSGDAKWHDMPSHVTLDRGVIKVGVNNRPPIVFQLSAWQPTSSWSATATSTTC
jgi:hypothetical protein